MNQQSSSVALLALTPAGHLRIVPSTDAAYEHAGIHDELILNAFLQSQEEGLLQLLATPIGDNWSLVMKHWRLFMAQYVEQLCHQLSSNAQAINAIAVPNDAQLQTWLLNLPPMPGGEYASTSVLAAIWTAFDQWCRSQIVAHPEGLAGFLSVRLPSWHQVGRVCFHLAENKQDPDYPFAFIATYATGLSEGRDVQYKPLNKALQDYAGDANKQALYHLLKPIYEAAKQCEWIRELVESRDIYHPMAWTPAEAYQLLQSIPSLEACGLVVKCPNWWQKRAKPKVQVSIGGQKNSLFSASHLLDFNVTIAIDGEPLTPDELDAINKAGTGLMMLRGQYIEVDQNKLQEALAHWQVVQAKVGANGVSFIEGMRLLAGAGHGLGGTEFSEELQEWSGITATGDLRVMLEKMRHPDTLAAKDLGGELCATLRPYQAIGVSWLDLLTELGLGACLADDMGLGKTIQVIALLLIQKKKKVGRPSLLVLPASLLANWKAELQQFAPSLKPLFLHSSELNKSDLDGFSEQTDNALDGYDVVVTTYGMLQRLLWLTSRQWHLAILDEAQAIKNPASLQTKQIKTLKAHAKVALTGTPIENRLGDLWSLYDFICPGLLGSSTRFKQFIKGIDSRQEGAYAPLRQLVQPYLLRRLKTDQQIISDLPDKTEMKAYCALSREQLTLYTQLVHDMAQALEMAKEGIQRKGLVLAYLTRFKQLCNHPGQFLGDQDYSEHRSGKFARLAELVESIVLKQEKVLVFTQYRAMTVPIAAYLETLFGRSGLVLHGGTPVAKRRALVDNFQTEQGAPFFVLSLKAGGTGLNLTAANHVIHFDRWWNPAVENQATDRAFRIGQRRNVLVHKLLCTGTIEDKIDQLIAQKVSLSSSVLQVSGEAILTEMTDTALLDLVRLHV